MKPSPHRLLVLLALFQPLAAQTDDFNDGNDTGWTRFAPLAAAGGTSYTFTGGRYRLVCTSSPDPGAFGPARAGSFRTANVYGTFCVSVDISGWSTTEDTSLGLLARVQPNPAPGAVNGYVLSFQSNDGDLEINRIIGEAPQLLLPLPKPVSLAAGTTYRMVFFGLGSHLEGRIYSLANLASPLVTVTATDETFATGINGLVVFGDQNTRVSATFDNYRADTGDAPALSILPAAGGGVELSWPAADALSWRLETATDLATWLPAPPPQITTGTAVLSISSVDPSNAPQQFFRFAKGP